MRSARAASRGRRHAHAPPLWPFSAAVLVAVVAISRAGEVYSLPVVPWRVVIQVSGLLIVTRALGIAVPGHVALGFPGLLATAGGVGAAAAIANNLPVSVCAAGLLASPAAAYAGSVGLGVGALALPQGSVATLIAAELSGASAPTLRARRLAPIAAGGVLLATILLWAAL